MSEYVLFNNNVVYKKTNDFDEHYIKVSPWLKGEDRRVTKNYINDAISNNFAQKIRKPKAKQIINNLFKKQNFYWIFNNKLFTVFSDSDPRAFLVNNFDKAVKHPYTIYRDRKKDFYLVYYNGKIYWTTMTQYNPRVNLWEFNGFDSEPTDYCPCAWTSIKNLRIIYQIVDFKSYKAI